MKKILLFIIATLALANEPSAFKAGDLDNPNPYGLTQSEKKIVEQNQNIQSISRNLFDTNQTQTELRNELDGIKSLLGSIGEKQMVFSEKMDSDKNGSLKDVNLKIEQLSKKIEDNFKLQNENYDKIIAMMSEFAKLVDDISTNYVSKEQLKLNMGRSYREFVNKESNVTVQQKSIDNNTTTTKKISDATSTSLPVDQSLQKTTTEKQYSYDELFAEAEKLYKSNNLDDSKNLFLKLNTQKGSKRASAQFYLGEIEYKNGEFKNALGYFQESINSDDKSSFIPLMLYHSAICLEKLNNKKDAKKVLDTLIKTYPKNYLVPSAKKKYSEL